MDADRLQLIHAANLARLRLIKAALADCTTTDALSADTLRALNLIVDQVVHQHCAIDDILVPAPELVEPPRQTGEVWTCERCGFGEYLFEGDDIEEIRRKHQTGPLCQPQAEHFASGETAGKLIHFQGRE